MRKLFLIIFTILLIFSNLYAQDENTTSEVIDKKKDYTTEYWLFGSVPTLVILWGIGAWGWGTAAHWKFKNDGWGIEQDSYTGGADKLGHLWGIYLASRVSSYVFEKSGDSHIRAALKGFAFSQFVGLGIEVGDGFGDTYGFSWGDMIWNLGGGLFALILDLYPPLDKLLGFQIEYWPSEDNLNQKDARILEITSDVTGQKYILALKFTGVPYLKNTFLQFFQIDFGYYTRGYWFSNSTYKYKTRHTYIGFTFNFSRISQRFVSSKRWRSSLTSFFKYYHIPIAYNPSCLDNTLSGKTRNTRD